MKLDPQLRLRHIAAFLDVARTGSVNAAAESLSITQPAVSKTIKELEEIVGVRLFDRGGRRLKLNPAGAAFQRLAGSGIAELERAQDTARTIARGPDFLRIGALPTAATDLLPEATVQMLALDPTCVMRVSTGPNWLLLSQLREGALDLVVGRMGDPSRMEGLTFRQLMSENVVAAVRFDHPLREFPSAADLQNYPLILPPPGAVIHQTVRSFLLSVGAGDVTPSFESVSLAFSRGVLKKSDAIWFISNGVIQDELETGALRTLPLNAPMLAGPVGISMRANSPPSESQERLINALTKVASTTP